MSQNSQVSAGPHKANCLRAQDVVGTHLDWVPSCTCAWEPAFINTDEPSPPPSPRAVKCPNGLRGHPSYCVACDNELFQPNTQGGSASQEVELKGKALFVLSKRRVSCFQCVPLLLASFRFLDYADTQSETEEGEIEDDLSEGEMDAKRKVAEAVAAVKAIWAASSISSYEDTSEDSEQRVRRTPVAPKSLRHSVY